MLVEVLKDIIEKKHFQSMLISDPTNSDELRDEAHIEYNRLEKQIESFPEILFRYFDQKRSYDNFSRNQNNYDNTLSIFKMAQRLDVNISDENFILEVNNIESNQILLDILKNKVEEKAFEMAENFRPERYELFINCIKKEMGVIKQ